MIRDALIRTSAPDRRVKAFCACGSNPWVYRHLDDPDRLTIRSDKCKDRWCVPCQLDRRRRLAAAVHQWAQDRPLKFVTLTIKQRDESLTNALQRLRGAWRRLSRSRWWQSGVNGAIAFLEVKKSPTTDRWHPHFHIIADAGYLPQAQLSALWLHLTHDSKIVDVRRVYDPEDAATYAAKYAAKPLNAKSVANPHDLDEALLTLKGRRLVDATGSARGLLQQTEGDHDQWIPIQSLRRMIAAAQNADPTAIRNLAILARTWPALAHPLRTNETAPG